MKIKLIRSGGLIPLIKTAEVETELSEQELSGLLELIQTDPSSSRIKDGNNWEFEIGERSAPIDPEKVPVEYKELFDKLRDNLKISR
jgi:hypothetical protein